MAVDISYIQDFNVLHHPTPDVNNLEVVPVTRVLTALKQYVRPAERIPAPVRRNDVVEAIMAEASCTYGQASSALDWIRGFVNRSRLSDYSTQYPTDAQMDTVEYKVFDAIMPHGTAPEPGSAADLVNQHVLDPARGENSLWHDTEYDRVGERYYCTVKVALGVI